MEILNRLNEINEANLTNKHVRFLFRRLNIKIEVLEQVESNEEIEPIMEDINDYLQELKEAIHELIETKDDKMTKKFVGIFFEMIETKSNGIEHVEHDKELTSRVDDISVFLVKLKEVTGELLLK
jgi:23S rRNA C2498 (ribose-2'-O)-methylase RlmM